MAQITASMVKQLREDTGAGMMDCKKALSDSDGDMEAAKDWLRKKGLSTAAKKAGRTTSDGLVGVSVSGTRGAVVEVNSETDFVARNDAFQNFVSSVADLAMEESADTEALKKLKHPDSGKTVEDTLTDLVAKIGENISLRRAASLSVSEGKVISYVHNKTTENLGKIGVLIALESSLPADVLEPLGKQLAMHVAAAAPEYLNIETVAPGALEKERAVLTEQARDSGKPDNIIEKMVEGRLRKFYEQVVLQEQLFVVDNETKISKVVQNAAKEAGGQITLAGYLRFELGEGKEKKEENFAEEVAAQAGA